MADSDPTTENEECANKAAAILAAVAIARAAFAVVSGASASLSEQYAAMRKSAGAHRLRPRRGVGPRTRRRVVSAGTVQSGPRAPRRGRERRGAPAQPSGQDRRVPPGHAGGQPTSISSMPTRGPAPASSPGSSGSSSGCDVTIEPLEWAVYRGPRPGRGAGGAGGAHVRPAGELARPGAGSICSDPTGSWRDVLVRTRRRSSAGTKRGTRCRSRPGCRSPVARSPREPSRPRSGSSSGPSRSPRAASPARSWSPASTHAVPRSRVASQDW